MSTAAQTAANRANAQLSTGPRTLEGKARVSQNAIRHGLTAKHLVIRDDEREDFTVFQNSLIADLDPQGALETITFHELLHAAWTLVRLHRVEAEVSTGKVRDFLDPQTPAILDRLGRYQARAQRAYYRAIQELRALQTNRALSTQVEETAAAPVPPLADIRKLTKQTQTKVTAKAPQRAANMVGYETTAIRLPAGPSLLPKP
jgi:hypothetical protein